MRNGGAAHKYYGAAFLLRNRVISHDSVREQVHGFNGAVMNRVNSDTPLCDKVRGSWFWLEQQRIDFFFGLSMITLSRTFEP